MKEWKASEKEAQKMTRDGAISVNMVTGEASHVSDRAPEQDYSPSGDSTVLARTALHHLDDRRVRKSQKKKRRNRRKAYREGTAANSRPSSRLQFSDEERAAPELQQAIRKSDKAVDKLDTARAAIPKKRVLGTERAFDETSGAGRTRLVFHETDKPASIQQPGPNPLTRPLQEVAHAAHAKVREVEQENSGVAAGHLTERGMEKAVGYGNRKLQNWRAERQVKPWRDAAKAEQAAVRANAEALYQKALHDNPHLASGSPISRIWQKKRMQRQYAAAYRASRGAEGAKAAAQTAARSAKKGAEAAKKAGEFIARHKKVFLIIGGVGLVLVLLLGLLQSCSSMFGGGVSNIVASSYLSEDADLLAAEAAYCAKEDELRRYLDT
uniref:CD1108 family mobile element protein n=1 Tax=Desulfovibrio sp. TaxID=885 RepID=UPI003AF528DB